MRPPLPPDLLATSWTIGGFAPGREEPEVSRHTPAERIEAVAAAGFTGIGFSAADLAYWEDEIGLEMIGNALTRNGIKHVELDFLLDWATVGEARLQSDQVRNLFLRAAQSFDVRHIKVGPEFGDGPLDPERLISEFGILCDQFAVHDVLVGIEPLPFGSLKTPADAYTMTSAAGRLNGGLAIDVWWISRAGLEPEVLLELPPGAIAIAELNDGPAKPIGPNLIDESSDARKLCGEGEFDLARFIAAVVDQGYSGPFGIEILSPRQRGRTPDVAAELAHTAAHQQFLQPQRAKEER